MVVWIEGGASSGGSGRSFTSDDVSWQMTWPWEKSAETPPVAPKVTPSIQVKARQPAGINLPESQEGTPAPYIAGTVRVDSNILWWGNDDTGSVTSQYVDPTGITATLTTYRDEIDVMFGICTGPGVHLRAIYGEKNDILWQGDAGVGVTVLSPGATGGVFSGGTCTWYSGELNQAANPVMTASISDPVPGFVGTAYLFLENGDRKITTPFSFEVQRIPNPLSLTTLVNKSSDGNDVNPISFVVDFMTTKFNGLGYDIGKFNTASMIAAANILASEGNFLSIAVSNEGVNASDVLSTVEAQIDGTFFIHPGTGLITVALFREDLVDLDDIDIPVFGMDDILDHPSWSKSWWNNASDQVRAIYSDRTDGYQQVPVIAQTVSVAAAGGRASKTAGVQFPLVCNKDLASDLAARELSLKSTPRHGMNVTTNRKGALLLPGDVIKVTYPPYQLNEQPFFVTRRRDLTKRENKVTLELSQFKSPNNAVFTPPEESGFFEQSRDPLAPESVLVMDAPYFVGNRRAISGVRAPGPFESVSLPMSLAQPYSRYQAAWYMQYDPAFNADPTYLIGPPGQYVTIGKYCSVGTLHSTINEFDGATNGLINIVVDDIFRCVNGPSMVNNAGDYMLIDDEILLIQTATLIGNTLTLTGVQRAMMDTVKQAHSAGAEVRVFNFAMPVAYTAGPTIVPSVAFDPAVSPVITPGFKYTGIAYANGAYTDVSPLNTLQSYTPGIRYQRPLRPHDTKINAGARSSSPVNLARSSTPTISFRVRSRWLTGYVNDTGTETRIWLPDTDWRSVYSNRQDYPQTMWSMYKEYDSDNSKYVQYRVMLKDSASVVWNMGNTADNDYLSHSLVVTVPAGAAVGSGLLWVEAYNDYSDSSPWKDTLPVNIT